MERKRKEKKKPKSDPPRQKSGFGRFSVRLLLLRHLIMGFKNPDVIEGWYLSVIDARIKWRNQFYSGGILNMLLSASNALALRAIYWTRAPPYMKFAVFLAMIFSAIYHMIERNKHSMNGAFVRLGKKSETTCLNLDRLCAMILAIALLLGTRMTMELFVLGSVALISLGISELPWRISCKLLDTPLFADTRTERRMYVMAHFIWHVLAFEYVFVALSQFGRNAN